MASHRIWRSIKIAGLGLILVAIPGAGGSASAKPDPAPFTPGSQQSIRFGPCQTKEVGIPWKCLDAKLKEAHRSGSAGQGSCLDPAIIETAGELLYWQCNKN